MRKFSRTLWCSVSGETLEFTRQSVAAYDAPHRVRGSQHEVRLTQEALGSIDPRAFLLTIGGWSNH